MAEARQYNYAVGRRKSSTAVIKLYPNGKGTFTVRLSSGKTLPLKDYFGGNTYMMDNVLSPFYAIDKNFHKKYDAEIVIRGGGMSGQSDAIRLGFSRALTLSSPDFRLTLKPLGFLKRDGRIKERKKPGLKKARKAPTWSKR